MEDDKSDIKAEYFQEIGVPRVTVRGICKHQGNIFVEYATDQVEMDRIYSLPGGAIKWGERSRDALRREFKEEFNMDVSVGRFLLVIENKFGTSKGRIHNVELVFELTTQSSEFDLMVPGLAGRWLDLNGIDKYNLKPDELREALFTQSLNRRKHLIAGDMKLVR